MKKIAMVVYTLYILLNLASCEKRNIKNLNSISYGTSFGMCVGYCYNDLLINGSKVTLSKTQRLLKDTKTCTKTITEAEVSELKALLSKSNITKMPETIGCPDCADGGAEWISLEADGKQYKITFEYGKAPGELKAAVEKLKALKESFNDCN